MGEEGTLRPFLERMFEYEKVGLEDGFEDNVVKPRVYIWSVAQWANISILVCSVICLIASAVVYRRASLTRENHFKALQSAESYSHLLPQIPLNTIKVTSAPLSNNASIYRQPPSPAVDAAWDRLSDIGTHLLTSAEIISLGKDPSKTVRLPSSWGYGSDAHMATLDGIHLVHCLNSMRKSLHPNFEYYYPSSEKLGPEYIPHLTHCVEAVLQHLMCRPSMEFLTHNWIERQEMPFPDFGVQKKCWDYEKILEWKEENRIGEIEKRIEAGELKPPRGWVKEHLPPLVEETWEIIDAMRAKTSGE